jgi:hypothetical protein
VTYINYILSFAIFLYYRNFFIMELHSDIYIFFLLFICEMILRLTWYILGCLDFIPDVYLHIISMVLKLALFSSLTPSKLYYRLSIYNVILVFVSLLTYFCIREQKTSFFYNLSLKIRIEWYKSIIDNMNSGFISIRDEQVQYYNKTLYSYISRSCCRQDEHDHLESIDINELFKDIQYEGGVICSFYK